MAWSPDGRFVWLTGARQDGFRAVLWTVSLGGVERVAYQPADPLVFWDVRQDGRTLASGGRYRYEMAGRPPGEAAERDLTWLGRSFVTDLSANGRAVLFEDGQFAKGRAFMFLRRTPRGRCSSPRARRPGSRRTAGGRSASPAQSARQLAVIPTGAGQARALPRGSIDRYLDAFWFPDGRRVLIVAQERDRPPRLFEQDVGKGEPRPVTPEGVATSHPTLAPDGTAVLAGTFEPGGMFRLYPLNGGEPTSVPGLLGGDKPLRFDGTGRFVFVRQLLPLEEDRAVIVRVDTQTARREHWLELRPSDRIGVGAIWMVRLSADGRGYAYSYSRDVSNLFPVRGLP